MCLLADDAQERRGNHLELLGNLLPLPVASALCLDQVFLHVKTREEGTRGHDGCQPSGHVTSASVEGCAVIKCTSIEATERASRSASRSRNETRRCLYLPKGPLRHPCATETEGTWLTSRF